LSYRTSERSWQVTLAEYIDIFADFYGWDLNRIGSCKFLQSQKKRRCKKPRKNRLVENLIGIVVDSDGATGARLLIGLTPWSMAVNTTPALLIKIPLENGSQGMHPLNCHPPPKGDRWSLS
jgi:hypothetical protein